MVRSVKKTKKSPELVKPKFDSADLKKKEMLTVKEAAQYSGMSVPYVYKQTGARRPENSDFPKPEKIGTRVMFRRADLDKFLNLPGSSKADPLRKKIEALANRLDMPYRVALEFVVDYIQEELTEFDANNQGEVPLKNYFDR